MLVFAIIAFCLFTGMVGFEIGFHFKASANKNLREELTNSVDYQLRLANQIQNLNKEIRDWEVRYNNLRDYKRL